MILYYNILIKHWYVETIYIYIKSKCGGMFRYFKSFKYIKPVSHINKHKRNVINTRKGANENKHFLKLNCKRVVTLYNFY
jgi:hypothetical protein